MGVGALCQLHNKWRVPTVPNHTPQSPPQSLAVQPQCNHSATTVYLTAAERTHHTHYNKAHHYHTTMTNHAATKHAANTTKHTMTKHTTTKHTTVTKHTTTTKHAVSTHPIIAKSLFESTNGLASDTSSRSSFFGMPEANTLSQQAATSLSQ